LFLITAEHFLPREFFKEVIYLFSKTELEKQIIEEIFSKINSAVMTDERFFLKLLENLSGIK